MLTQNCRPPSYHKTTFSQSKKFPSTEEKESCVLYWVQKDCILVEATALRTSTTWNKITKQRFNSVDPSRSTQALGWAHLTCGAKQEREAGWPDDTAKPPDTCLRIKPRHRWSQKHDSALGGSIAEEKPDNSMARRNSENKREQVKSPPPLKNISAGFGRESLVSNPHAACKHQI